MVPEGSVKPASHAPIVEPVVLVMVTVPEYPPHQLLETEKLVDSATPDEEVESGAVVVVLEVVVEVGEVVVVDEVVEEVVAAEVHPVANSPDGLPAFLEPDDAVNPKLVEAPGASWPFQLALPKV